MTTLASAPLLDEHSRLATDPAVRFRRLEREGVVLQMDEGTVLVLDALGAGLLERIGVDGSDIASLADWVVSEYQVSREVAMRDLLAFAQELVAARVLLVSDGG